MSTGTTPLRVLIADDHAPTRADVAQALAGDDRFHVCAETADAPAAVAAAMRERPDICVLDVRMPGGGLSAAWEITARLPRTKVVMLTVSAEDSDLFAALRAGAAGYLMKTISLGELPDALVGVCAGEAAMQPTLVARVLMRFRAREPRWRQPVDAVRANTGPDGRAPGPPGPGGQRRPTGRLTSREWEVLEMLSTGRSTADISRVLVITTSAARVHIASIVRKLGVRDRVEAAQLFGDRQESL